MMWAPLRAAAFLCMIMAVTADRISVAALYTGTGPNAAIGKQYSTAWTLWQKYVNNVLGGIVIGTTKYTVDVKLIDVGADTDAAAVQKVAAALQGLDSTTNYIFAPYGDALTEATALNAGGRLVLAPGTSGEWVTFNVTGRRFPNLFVTVPPTESYFNDVLLLHQQDGHKVVSFFWESRSELADMCSDAMTFARSQGMAVLDQVSVTDPTVDATANSQKIDSMLQQFTSSQPDLIVGCVTGKTCGTLLSKLASSSYTPLGVALSDCSGVSGVDTRFVITADVWSPLVRGVQYREDAGHPVGMYLTDIANHKESAEQFASAFTTESGGVAPTSQAAAALAAAYALHVAVKSSASLAASDVINRMSEVYISSSFFGPISFDSYGRARSPHITLQPTTKTSTQIIAPWETATADVTYPFPTVAQKKCLDAGKCSVHGVCQRDGTCKCSTGYVGSTCSTADIKFRTLLEEHHCRGLYAAVVILILLWIFSIIASIVALVGWRRVKRLLMEKIAQARGA